MAAGGRRQTSSNCESRHSVKVVRGVGCDWQARRARAGPRAVSRAGWAPVVKGAHIMRGLMEITPDGDLIADDGEVHTLFSFDSEALGEEPLE